MARFHSSLWYIEYGVYMYHAKSLQSCLTLCDPMGCSPPGFSVHGILQARILEWVAVLFTRGSSQPRDQTHVSLRFSALVGRFFTTRITWEALSPSIVHVSILFQIIFPMKLLQNIEQNFLCYTVGPCWLSILNTAVCTCESQTP